jgi:hypothetical protein
MWRTDTANQRGGSEWEPKKNSIQEFGLWTQFHSYTSTSFSCQVHTATGVLLDLGARPNQQPRDTRSGNTHDTTAGSPNRSGRFLKPVRPLLLDLASHRQGKPVRPVWQIGQAGSVQKLPKDPSERKPTSRTSSLLNKNNHSTTRTSLLRNSSRQPIGLNRSDQFGKPVRPIWETSQTGFGLDSREELHLWEKLKPSINRSPDPFHGSKWNFADSWGTLWATLG